VTALTQGRARAAAQDTSATAGAQTTGRWRYAAAALCVAIMAIMLMPIALSFLASIKPAAENSASPPNYLPMTLSTENYEKIIDYQAGLATYAFNSFAVAGLAIVICLAVSIPAGYGLARFQIRGKEAIFILLLAPMMIPYQALLTPLYLTFAKLGLTNTHLGLAIVHAVLQLPFSIYLMRNSFEGIPKELEEAAKVDGTTSFQTLTRIFLPLVLPGIVTVALFAFIASWNEFLSALIFMNSERSFTVPIMLVSVRSGTMGAVDWGALQAGVIVSILPCVVVYLLLQKYYMAGFLTGAVK
jgi:multiple sugar transport system permease protein